MASFLLWAISQTGLGHVTAHGKAVPGPRYDIGLVLYLYYLDYVYPVAVSIMDKLLNRNAFLYSIPDSRSGVAKIRAVFAYGSQVKGYCGRFGLV